MNYQEIQPNNFLYVNKSTIIGSGKGVFTKIDLPKNQAIERAPIIKELLSKILDTTLNHYIFQHPYDRKYGLIALGYGSLFNHQDDNNLDYYFDVKNKCIVFETIKDIKQGEELFIHYGNDWWITRKNKIKMINL